MMGMQISASQKCAGCGHPFGIHFTSYDSTRDGCGHLVPGYSDQREGYTYPTTPCPCKGFSVTFRPALNDYNLNRSSGYQPSRSGWGGPGEPYGT